MNMSTYMLCATVARDLYREMTGSDEDRERDTAPKRDLANESGQRVK